MIPNHRALVPVNEYQLAAIRAVVLVERKKELGKRLAEYPYAKAFFRALNGGRGQILANDIRRISSNYFPGERGGASIAQYVAALDLLIESGGRYSPLPLAGDVAAKLFPAYGAGCRERRERRWDMQYDRKERRRSREEQQKRRRYRNLLAQAAIELDFATPDTVDDWYAQWRRTEIYEDDLSDRLHRWCERFPCLARYGIQNRKGEPLWSIIDRLKQVARDLTDAERTYNDLLLENKLAYIDIKV